MDKERKSLQKHAAHALVPITSVPTVRSSALASCLNRKQTCYGYIVYGYKELHPLGLALFP